MLVEVVETLVDLGKAPFQMNEVLRPCLLHIGKALLYELFKAQKPLVGTLFGVVETLFHALHEFLEMLPAHAFGHQLPSRLPFVIDLARVTKARTLAASFVPGVASTPLHTSTA